MAKARTALLENTWYQKKIASFEVANTKLFAREYGNGN